MTKKSEPPFVRATLAIGLNAIAGVVNTGLGAQSEGSVGAAMVTMGLINFGSSLISAFRYARDCTQHGQDILNGDSYRNDAEGQAQLDRHFQLD